MSNKTEATYHDPAEPQEITWGAMAANHRDNDLLLTPVGRTRTTDRPVRAFPFEVGDTVRFHADHYVFTVQAIRENYVVLNAGKKQILYTIIEWSSGLRGPHTSWGHSAETRFDCEETAGALQSDYEAEAKAIARPDIGTDTNPWPCREIELSARNKIYLDIRRIDRDGTNIWGER